LTEFGPMRPYLTYTRHAQIFEPTRSLPVGNSGNRDEPHHRVERIWVPTRARSIPLLPPVLTPSFRHREARPGSVTTLAANRKIILNPIPPATYQLFLAPKTFLRVREHLRPQAIWGWKSRPRAPLIFRKDDHHHEPQTTPCRRAQSSETRPQSRFPHSSTDTAAVRCHPAGRHPGNSHLRRPTRRQPR
jgi:hypothetical protein